MCPYHSSVLAHVFPVIARFVARSRAAMAANLFGGAIEAAYNPSSLVMESIEHTLILVVIHIAIDVTDQVIGCIGASTSCNASIHIDCNHVPAGMAFYIWTRKGAGILSALHEPGNLSQHIVICNRDICFAHVVQDLYSAFIHFLWAQKMIVDAASLRFDKI